MHFKNMALKFPALFKRRLIPTLFAGSLLAVMPYCACANDTISLDAGWLYGAAGTAALPQGSLLLLVVSSSGTTFGGPTVGSFTSAGDTILGTAQGSNNNNGTGGLGGNGSETFNNINASISTSLVGHDVALYWFPGITKAQYSSGVTPTAGTIYGAYNPQAISITTNANQDPDGGSPWTAPTDNGGNPILEFFTALDEGSQNELEGTARFTVLIPEPSTYALLGLGALALAGMQITKRRRVAQPVLA
jgi:hypothetical protein